ncbi:MAG: hypothetical protein LBC20_05040 [Planctomycetaceae bacterium]|jgi:hypothetical protein|nr:hypothetical protein [Planctomycetaceae bacterium]
MCILHEKLPTNTEPLRLMMIMGQLRIRFTMTIIWLPIKSVRKLTTQKQQLTKPTTAKHDVIPTTISPITSKLSSLFK